jgi:hypothetical protein
MCCIRNCGSKIIIYDWVLTLLMETNTLNFMTIEHNLKEEKHLRFFVFKLFLYD